MSTRQLRQTSSVLVVAGVILGQFIVGFTPAFAEKKPKNDDQNQNDNQGRLLPVWCKYAGHEWKAQLSANSNGKDEPLYGPVEDYTVNDDNQVLAHDRSNKLDAACADQYQEEEEEHENEHGKPEKIDVPAAPETQDPCNAYGSAKDFSNISWKTPVAGTGYTWELSEDGETYTAIADEGYIFKTDDKKRVESVSYDLPQDSGVLCGMGGTTTTPTTTETSAVVQSVTTTTAQATTAELPHTGPASATTTAMSALVLPVLAYGLVYLGREQFGL